jgi:hypothetical protein
MKGPEIIVGLFLTGGDPVLRLGPSATQSFAFTYHFSIEY